MKKRTKLLYILIIILIILFFILSTIVFNKFFGALFGFLFLTSVGLFLFMVYLKLNDKL
jgi:hypothetical protein